LGVQRDDHAVIYTGHKAPKELPGEGLVHKPIEVIPKTPRDKLEPNSRINFAKIYTVEHNVKVMFIGQISKNSERAFMSDFDSVWDNRNKINYSGQSASQSPFISFTSQYTPQSTSQSLSGYVPQSKSQPSSGDIPQSTSEFSLNYFTPQSTS
jgi:hypothetical protein